MKRARLRQRAHAFYQPDLRQGEEIVQVYTAYAARTAILVTAGSLLGGFVGWLYAGYLSAAPLPGIMLGGFAGINAGFFYAESVARKTDGPGTTKFALIVTNERLITLRVPGGFRSRVLRTYDRDSIVTIDTQRLPIGQYHHTVVQLTSGRSLALVVDGKVDIDPVNTAAATG